MDRLLDGNVGGRTLQLRSFGSIDNIIWSDRDNLIGKIECQQVKCIFKEKRLRRISWSTRNTVTKVFQVQSKILGQKFS